MLLLGDIAAQGLSPQGRGAWGPCPCCGATQRGRQDRRGPLSFKGETWRCHAGACGAGGGPGALLAALRLGVIPPKGDPRWAAVLRELSGDGETVLKKEPPAPPPPNYPPRAEVQALWNFCWSLENLERAHPAIAFLESRRLDARVVGLFDLARALPENYPWPPWIIRAIPSCYHLVIPVYDNTGLLRSLRFRATRDPGTLPKTLPPRGYDLGGLVMADSLGLALLRGVQAVDGIQWDGRVVIAEGEPDFLSFATDETRCTRAIAQQKTHAVLGVVSGSWSASLAARIPTGATVAVWTHLDSKGNLYAETIRKTLGHRCDVRRPAGAP